MSILVLPITVPSLKEDGSNWATFATCFQEAMQATHHWGHFYGTNTCPVPKDAAHPMNVESETIKEWNCKDVVVQGLLSPRLPDWIFIQLVDHKTAKGHWEQLIEELSQPAFADKPEAIGEGAHTHDDHAELDLKEGQLGDLNMNTPEGVAHGEPDSTPGEEISSSTPVHLEGTGPEVLIEEEVDHLLKVEEDGPTGKAASVEGDASPCVELQDPGVSCLATQENAGSLTLPSPPPPPTTLETASTQCSPAANTGMLDIPVPDHSADLELLPHNTPLPNKAAEPPIHQPPKQTQAPTGVGGSLESLPGEASQCAKGQRSLTSVHALEGNMPIGEAHGCPPDLPNLQRQSSIAWEPMFVVPKA